MRPTPTIAAAVGVSVALLGGLTGCGGSHQASGCGPIRHEALDPQFLVHVLGDANVQYTSDPPTSGPHQPTPPVSGARTQPISKPRQVGILEDGEVLLQYGPRLPADQRRQLVSLAGTDVVVAPDPDLRDTVVATAWVYKRTCSSVDTGALRDFIRARQGKGPSTTLAP